MSSWCGQGGGVVSGRCARGVLQPWPCGLRRRRCDGGVAAKRVIGTAGADLGDRLAIEDLVWQHARVTDPATNDCDGSDS